MKLSSIRLSLSLVLSLTVGCLGADDSTGRGVDEVCGAPSDCASGLECEFEHGVGTCQPHGDGGARDAASAEVAASDAGTSSTGCATNADCASGLECEVEHGVGACRPHRGGDGGEADASSADVTSGGAVGASCAVDVDCAAGLECEVEHGAGTCQPHGGRR